MWRKTRMHWESSFVMLYRITETTSSNDISSRTLYRKMGRLGERQKMTTWIMWFWNDYGMRSIISLIAVLLTIGFIPIPCNPSCCILSCVTSFGLTLKMRKLRLAFISWSIQGFVAPKSLCANSILNRKSRDDFYQ